MNNSAGHALIAHRSMLIPPSWWRLIFSVTRRPRVGPAARRPRRSLTVDPDLWRGLDRVRTPREASSATACCWPRVPQRARNRGLFLRTNWKRPTGM
jgi:hypothetical protein